MQVQAPGPEESAALAKLLQLPQGRHYGASADSGCWVMVGRRLADVATWSIVPPHASMSLAWGDGGCEVEFAGGAFEVRRGQCMWIDAGFAHRGENLLGSDFLTVFIPAHRVSLARIDLARIGAASANAPEHLASLLIGLAAHLLDGGSTRLEEAPVLDAVLDHVGTMFGPNRPTLAGYTPVLRAAAMLRQSEGHAITIASISEAVGLRPTELSRQFKAYHRITPEAYRKQVRLAHATRALANGSSVLHAAHEAGFADTAHLSRTFRDQYGLAPSRWAKRFMRTQTSADKARPGGR
ncbi:hypothetical protein GCM10007973_24710 [Polymorphobacter multimanifer]|uniref:AraC-like DNA-binding protein n=1 Tax=Polymorphobacter multimanifer TaxID=1070431 RepID=A0A841L2C4_9SPHN|nr:AraC family transcriptional regulator [Polymorphobacter multimanifer]MBB6226466.1 AraC-like DNA-binding protein [Polymorphobacter multimanifer]GGI87310.1 hypothetical protein GCM10007973_24710 [Polymorphobacter multimanifer]